MLIVVYKGGFFMHFVIGLFIALVCLALSVLFANVFPKWFKFVLAVVGVGTSGYALAILIRKIAILTKIYAQPKLWPTTAICVVIMIIVTFVALKTIRKKQA